MCGLACVARGTQEGQLGIDESGEVLMAQSPQKSGVTLKARCRHVLTCKVVSVFLSES